MTPYADIGYADNYFDTCLHHETWDDSDNDQKNRALFTSTRLIDLLDYVGDKTSSTQELEFPRNGMTDVPEAIKIACCELAQALLDGVDPELERVNQTVLSAAFGPAQIRHDRTVALENVVNMIPSCLAWAYLRPYLRNQQTLNICRVS